jgi:hypothetical protein
LEKPLQMQNCPLCGQSKINPDKPEKTNNKIQAPIYK